MVIGRGGVWAALVVAATALLAAVLVPFGGWHPWIAVPLVLAAAAGAGLVARRVPTPAVPAWAQASLLAIAAGHGVWAWLTHAEHVVLRRDAGSYALYTQWIATRHGLPIPGDVDAFGGAAALADPAFRLASPAFFEVGQDLVPQFLLGAPAVFSLGWWTAGWDGVFAAPAIASALAILAFAGLAVRLVAPGWAVLATAVLAVCQPVIHAARSTYSEPLALLFVAVAAALLVEATRARGDAAARLALAAGATAGLAGLVRVDAVREVALLMPVAAVLALRGHPAGRPLATGALGGIAVAAIPALVLSRPYLGEIAASLLPLLAGTVVLGAASLWAARRGARPPRELTWLRRPDLLAGGAVLLVAAVLTSRPLWTVVRQDPDDPGSRVVAGLQLRQGLTVDGGRTYAEHSVNWVSWYLGWAAVAAAWLAFAWFAARAVAWWRGGDGEPPGWLGPAFVALGSLVLTLYRPGITPDHPWADRRLVPVVLPAVVLASVAAAAWAARRFRPRPVVAGIGALALAAPAVWGTAGVATEATERREPVAAEVVCSVLREGDVVVALDARAANEWPQLVRGVCGRPAASVRVPAQPDDDATAQALADAALVIAARARAAGSTPVLIAAEELGVEALRRAGQAPIEAVRLDTTEDARPLTERPDSTAHLDVDLWYARL